MMADPEGEFLRICQHVRAAKLKMDLQNDICSMGGGLQAHRMLDTHAQ